MGEVENNGSNLSRGKDMHGKLMENHGTILGMEHESPIGEEIKPINIVKHCKPYLVGGFPGT